MIEEKPLISVVIPTYNRKFALLKAIDSVLKQTYTKIEIIIVDNGSSDGTEEIVKKIKDNRIKYFFMKNLGANPARNLGIKKSQGNYIAFLDDDDEWIENKLEKQLERIKTNEEIGLVYTGKKIRYIQDNLEYQSIPKSNNQNIYMQNFVGTTSSVLIKRNLLESVKGFDCSLPALQDYELWIRLSKITKFSCIKEALVIYNNDNSLTQISNNTKKYEEAYEYINKKYINNNFDAKIIKKIKNAQINFLILNSIRNNNNVKDEYVKKLSLFSKIYYKFLILLGYKNLVKFKGVVSSWKNLFK